MSTSEQSPIRTRMFARAMGPFFTIAQPGAAVIVSVIGWFLAIRGVLLLTVPQAYDAAGTAVYSSGATVLIWVLFICLASAGLYLTYVGWKPQRTSQDRPHAAGD
ncbi:hypothetical protein [Mycobacterium sp.]|uniref:hypothetical protein n=1 Tax=Mycobacterium sp. TaxID=1785 RepID=UPI00126D5F34|nr:hypothetical protein [Mycobacterium sp.]KAA8962750.1 MAG: hypothetical protein F6Q13_11745 [Mycobacterium sp.]